MTTETGLPLMERVTLRGGPLDGLVRHVYRRNDMVRFRDPERAAYLHLYRRERDGVWRHVEETA
jgi:hypothetical protein